MTNRMRIIGTAALATTVFLLAAGCSAPSTPDGGATSQLAIGLGEELSTLDSGQVTGGDQRHYWSAVYDTLLERLPDGTIGPNAAESWEFSEDGLMLTLELRDDMTFSDGTPVTADAAAASFARFQELSPSAGNVSSVTSAEATDEHELTLTLSERAPSLLYFLTNTAGIIGNPTHFDDADFASVGAGSGPYVLDADRTAAGSEYYFVRNEGYWNAEAYDFDEILLKALTEPTARLNALRSGQIGVAALDPQNAQGLGGNLETTNLETTWGGLFIMDRDGVDVPALADPRVRQALNMAFDRVTMAETLMEGYATPTNQIYPPDSPAYSEQLADVYDYDVDAAQALMSEAGYADGFDLSMPSTSGTQFLEPALADALGEIGVRVTYVPVPAEQFIDRLLNREFPVFYLEHAMDNAWADLSREVRPQATWNLYGNETDTLNQLMSEVLAAANVDEENSVYASIGEYLIDEAWFAPIWYVQQPIAHDPSIEVTPIPGASALLIANYSAR